jgi:hypothetical protein
MHELIGPSQFVRLAMENGNIIKILNRWASNEYDSNE